MESKKRERSANFNAAEVQLLVSLVAKYKHILENKKTDAVTNKDKETTWRKIEDTFNACGVLTCARSWKTLKLKYEGLKKNTKKKSSLQRQELYRTGGGPSNAPDFDDIEEKVLSICSNIKGLDARHDSDTIARPILDGEVEPCIPDIQVPNCDDNPCEPSQMNDSIVIIAEDNTSQNENKWDKWQPKTLKTRVSNVLKTTPTKSSVTSKLDRLSEARLEVVKLQMEAARNEIKFREEEHKLKIIHMANDEKRKGEIHTLLLKKMSCKCGHVQEMET